MKGDGSITKTDDGNWMEGRLCVNPQNGWNEKEELLAIVGAVVTGDGNRNHTGMAVGGMAGDLMYRTTLQDAGWRV